MWGSLSGTIGRASHSLISHTKGARSTGEVEGQQRLVSLLLTASPHSRHEQQVIVRRGQLSWKKFLARISTAIQLST